jgi:prophage regulatory protein
MEEATNQMINLPKLETGSLLRLSSILAPHGPIPVSKSSWWLGVKQGRFPRPVKLGRRTTAWRAEDIAALVERGANVRKA